MKTNLLTIITTISTMIILHSRKVNQLTIITTMMTLLIRKVNLIMSLGMLAGLVIHVSFIWLMDMVDVIVIIIIINIIILIIKDQSTKTKKKIGAHSGLIFTPGSCLELPT